MKVGGRHLSPIVGLPCRLCNRPTGSLDNPLCYRCEGLKEAPPELCYAVVSAAWGAKAARRLFPGGAPKGDAA